MLVAAHHLVGAAGFTSARGHFPSNAPGLGSCSAGALFAEPAAVASRRSVLAKAGVPAIFGVDLVDEFMNVRQSMGVDRARLGKLIQNGIYATFLPKAEQDALWKKAAKIVDPFVAGGS